MGLTGAQGKMIHEKAEIKTLVTLSFKYLKNKMRVKNLKTTRIIFLCMAVGRTCFQI
jgi:hypothetical protein